MTLGLASGHVTLLRFHDDWAAAFARERARILETIGEHVVTVEHVGSTSIPPVPAKPILDIMIGVEDFDEARVCIAGLIALGYGYRGEHGIPRRHYFVKGEPRTHHVHMVELESVDWRVTLQFRDLLRCQPALATAYAQEKERLARRYANDRRGYQREKGEIIRRMLASEGTRLESHRG